MYRMIGKIIAVIVLFGLGILAGGYFVPGGIDSSCMVDHIFNMSYEQTKKEIQGLGVVKAKEKSEFEGNTIVPYFDDVNESICYNQFMKDFEASEEKYKPIFKEKINGVLKKCKVFG